MGNIDSFQKAIDEGRLIDCIYQQNKANLDFQIDSKCHMFNLHENICYSYSLREP